MSSHSGASFEKARPSWLRGMSIKGGDLELDGYNEELRIAFECDGPTHYDVDYIKRKYGLTTEQAQKFLRIQKANDQIKTAECNRRGITLIRLNLSDVDYSEFQEFITEKYKFLTGNEAPQRSKLDYKKTVRLLRSSFLGLDFFL